MRKHIRFFAAVVAVVLYSASLVGRSWADENILSNLGLLEQLTRGAAEDVASQLQIPKGAPVVIVSLAEHQGNGFVKERLAKELASRGYDVIISRAPAGTDGATAAAPSNGNGQGKAKPAANGGADAAGAGAAGADAAGVDAAGADAAGADAAGADAAGADAGAGTAVGGDPADGGASAGPTAEDEVVASQDPVAMAELALAHALPDDPSVAPTVLDVEILEFGVRYSEVSRKLLLGPVQFTRVAGVYLRVTEHDGRTGYTEDMITAERHHWDRVAGRERLLAEGANYPFDRPELKAPGLGTYLEPVLVVGIVSGLVFLFYENQN